MFYGAVAHKILNKSVPIRILASISGSTNKCHLGADCIIQPVPLQEGSCSICPDPGREELSTHSRVVVTRRLHSVLRRAQGTGHAGGLAADSGAGTIAEHYARAA